MRKKVKFYIGMFLVLLPFILIGIGMFTPKFAHEIVLTTFLIMIPCYWFGLDLVFDI